MSDYLLLKWGTLKSWQMKDNQQCLELLKKYFPDGVPFSAATDIPNEERRKILCELIDKFNGRIENDWSGEIMSKDDAKQYVMGSVD